MATYDSNGKKVQRNVAQNSDGTWSANVWFGGLNGLATNVRRYTYATRQEARDADISDENVVSYHAPDEA